MADTIETGAQFNEIKVAAGVFYRVIRDVCPDGDAKTAAILGIGPILQNCLESIETYAASVGSTVDIAKAL